MTKEIMRHTGSGNRLQMLRLQNLNIEPCLACYSCKKPGKKCPQNDDMQFLLSRIDNADAIIMSCPVYNWGAHIGIQKVIDRLFLFPEWAERLKGKPCVTFVTYGVPYEDGYALHTLNGLARELHLRVKETAAFLGSSPGEVLKYPKNMEAAKVMGQALLDPLYKRNERNFECPNCFSTIIRFRLEMDFPSPEVRPVGAVECAFCGTVVEIEPNQNKLELHYQGKGLFADETTEKLANFHADTLRSFAEQRKKIKQMGKIYKKMDVEIVSAKKETP
jgi:multimeric flavodoxin WrbA